MNEMIRRVGQALRTFDFVGKPSGPRDIEWFVIKRGPSASDDLEAANPGSGYLDFTVASMACRDANARAVIEAMREPTVPMIAAADVAAFDTYGNAHQSLDPEAAWRAMIDAALKE